MKSDEKFYISFEGKTATSKGPFLVYRDGRRFAMLESEKDAKSVAALGNSRNALAAAVSAFLKDAERVEVGSYVDRNVLEMMRAALQKASQ